jgi:PAS domain S-box-containing protein
VSILVSVLGAIAIVSTVVVILLLRRDRKRKSDFRRVADLAPLGMIVFDGERLLYANKRVAELVGLDDLSSHIGAKLDEIVTPNVAARARSNFRRVQRAGGPVSVPDVPIVTNNGARLLCDLKMVPIRFGGMDAVQCLFVGVDDKHAALKALERSEERFQRFFEDMPVPMYRTRPDGTIVHANEALASLLGAGDPQGLIGADAAEFYAERNARARFAKIENRRDELVDQISLLNGAGGRRVWVRDWGHTVVDDGGEIFEGILVDITDGQRAIQELELRARQEQAVAQVSQVALKQTDLADVLQEAVEQVCTVLNAECALIAQDQSGHGLLTTATAFRTDSSQRRAVLYTYLGDLISAADGEGPLYLQPVATAHDKRSIGGVVVTLIGPGEPYGVLAVGGAEWMPRSRDLDFLTAVAATLGSAIERSAARARMNQLMRSKDQFVASVSHELRTPLTVVAGLATELETSWRAFSETEVGEFISLIADQSREMTDLIEDLLVVARADIGKVPIRTAPCDIRECVDQVVASCALTDRARIHTAGDGITAVVDPVRFRQIIRNLVTNAVRYGGPQIRISVSESNGRARVSVFDNGSGIAEEHRDRIFEAYERAHSTSRVPGSVGLGLTVSQKLAAMMDGTISYRYDGGSYFEVDFPLATLFSAPERDVAHGAG